MYLLDNTFLGYWLGKDLLLKEKYHDINISVVFDTNYNTKIVPDLAI